MKISDPISNIDAIGSSEGDGDLISLGIVYNVPECVESFVVDSSNVIDSGVSLTWLSTVPGVKSFVSTVSSSGVEH